jgi:hypothetical protein
VDKAILLVELLHVVVGVAVDEVGVGSGVEDVLVVVGATHVEVEVVIGVHVVVGVVEVDVGVGFCVVEVVAGVSPSKDHEP